MSNLLSVYQFDDHCKCRILDSETIIHAYLSGMSGWLLPLIALYVIP